MEKSSTKSVFVVIVGVLSFLYLLNPTMGVFELIPDNVPLIGNLDEVSAVYLLFSALKYFGYDIKNLFKRK